MSIKSGVNTRLAVCITILFLVFTLILDRLVSEGMFLDGITYASISRNLAIGKGTFWAPYYRNHWIFSEHPPLMFGLEAIFFKIFGDHYLTEKIYSFAVWLTSLILIKKIWTTYYTEEQYKYSFAIPALLWCLAPTVTWTYTNNMLDCTMAMFDLSAILFIIKAYLTNNSKKQLLYLLGAGIFVSAAMLTKGPVGIFPLAVPVIHSLVFNMKRSKLLNAFAHSCLILLIVIVIYFVLYQIPDARASFERYLHEQLIAALGGEREITGGLGRLTLAYELLIQLLPSIGLAIVLLALNKVFKTKKDEKANMSYLFFFLLIGLSASLPMMMSIKQRSFYLIPSLPYFTIAASVLITPYFIDLTDKLAISGKSLKRFNIVAICIVPVLCFYLFSKIGQVGRDHQLISNVKFLQTQFPKGQVFGICQAADKDYGFLAYLQRYNQMEVTPAFYKADYVLIDKEMCNNDIIPIISKMGLKKHSFGLQQYELFQVQMPLKFDFTLLNPAFRTADK